MKRKVFRSMSLLACAAVLVSMMMAAFVLYSGVYSAMREKVKNEAAYVAAAVNLSGEAYFSSVRGVSDQSRITLVEADGTVLYDSFKPAAELENHLSRPEISGALQNGQAESERLSSTLGEITFYYAVRLSDGSVLRVANAVDSVYKAVFKSLPYMTLTVMGAALLSMLAARLFTKRIVRPINAIDLEKPLQNDVYDELSPLLSRIDRQNKQIETQLSVLRDKQLELASIAQKMAEGLLLLDKRGNVLSFNESALRLLNVKEGDYLNRHVLSMNRSMALRTALELAQRGVSNEQSLETDGRALSLMASPVQGETGSAGTVVFVVDITEKHEAEKRRREFTANVSHELKTPLTSISGYAEIIMNGIAKEEDVSRFAKSIYLEAQRMIALVEDIMELSLLDEGAQEQAKECVPLLNLAREAAESLQESAAKKNVRISFEGEALEVMGIRQILFELVYNLIDNAVKYNRDGGSVKVKVLGEKGGVALTVSDTGIGIPREEHERVFERFYRVDKSHAKETGGTGLGLSIVKHAALRHKAKVSLESEPGKGTAVTVVFPE
jgi:two-component system phosphate regulon sensor histidine kinase PhoR